MARIPVLIFTNSFRPGGSERQAVELIRHLDRSRFQPMLACLQHDGALTDDLPRDLGGVQVFPLAGGFFNRTALHQAARFVHFLRRTRIQVVQGFDFYTNLFALPLARLAGVPVVLGSRREEALTKTWKQRQAELWCYRRATGVVANAEKIKDQLVRRDGLRSERIYVIRNGLDLDRFDQQADIFSETERRSHSDVTIAVLAHFRREKGHLVFLEAARRLLKKNPSVRFQLIGDGPLRGPIETRIQDLGLVRHVSLLGLSSNVPQLLRAVDILVLPSLTEAFPNAVMEAMAASLPVVATDTGGTRELIVDGHTGYVVRPGDADALADRMRMLCDDPDTRRKMGEAGRRRIVEGFTVEKMADNFGRLYLRLLGAAGVGGTS